MMRLTRNNGSHFSKTMATGLALLLFLSLLSGCTARHMPDNWSRVQAVPRETRTVVRLYKDKAPRESRKIRGRFHSVAADSITLKLKDGQMRTLEKQDVRKVRIHRPYLHRWPGWAALGVGGLIVGLLGDLDGPASNRFYAQVSFNLPIAAAFFFGSGMKGIYRPVRQPGSRQGQAPAKPEDP